MRKLAITFGLLGSLIPVILLVMGLDSRRMRPDERIIIVLLLASASLGLIGTVLRIADKGKVGGVLMILGVLTLVAFFPSSFVYMIPLLIVGVLSLVAPPTGTPPCTTLR